MKTARCNVAEWGVPVVLPRISWSKQEVSLPKIARTLNEVEAKYIFRQLLEGWEFDLHTDLAMDQYLYIPFLGGWTSIYQLFWCELQGDRVLTHPHLAAESYEITLKLECCELDWCALTASRYTYCKVDEPMSRSPSKRSFAVSNCSDCFWFLIWCIICVMTAMRVWSSAFLCFTSLRELWQPLQSLTSCEALGTCTARMWYTGISSSAAQADPTGCRHLSSEF